MRRLVPLLLILVLVAGCIETAPVTLNPSASIDAPPVLTTEKPESIPAAPTVEEVTVLLRQANQANLLAAACFYDYEHTYSSTPGFFKPMVLNYFYTEVQDSLVTLFPTVGALKELFLNTFDSDFAITCIDFLTNVNNPLYMDIDGSLNVNSMVAAYPLYLGEWDSTSVNILASNESVATACAFYNNGIMPSLSAVQEFTLVYEQDKWRLTSSVAYDTVMSPDNTLTNDQARSIANEILTCAETVELFAAGSILEFATTPLERNYYPIVDPRVIPFNAESTLTELINVTFTENISNEYLNIFFASDNSEPLYKEIDGILCYNQDIASMTLTMAGWLLDDAKVLVANNSYIVIEAYAFAANSPECVISRPLYFYFLEGKWKLTKSFCALDRASDLPQI